METNNNNDSKKRQQEDENGSLVFVSLVLAVVAAMFEAWVTVVLYSWFLLPLGLPHISVTNMLGILLIFGYLRRAKAEKETFDQRMVFLVSRVLVGGVALLVGLIIQAFM